MSLKIIEVAFRYILTFKDQTIENNKREYKLKWCNDGIYFLKFDKTTVIKSVLLHLISKPKCSPHFVFLGCSRLSVSLSHNTGRAGGDVRVFRFSFCAPPPAGTCLGACYSVCIYAFKRALYTQPDSSHR